MYCVALRLSPGDVTQQATWLPPCGVRRVIQKRSQLYTKKSNVSRKFLYGLSMSSSPNLNIYLLWVFFSFKLTRKGWLSNDNLLVRQFLVSQKTWYATKKMLLQTSHSTVSICVPHLKRSQFSSVCRTDIFPALFHLPFYLKILTIVWKNIEKSVFVAVQDSCTYAGTKLCLNDHYLCETFSLGWTIHHCNATPMWGLISLLVLNIEHLSQLAWMPTYGTAIRDFRHQTAVYLESLLWHELTATAPCHASVTSETRCERQPGWGNNQWTTCVILYIMWL